MSEAPNYERTIGHILAAYFPEPMWKFSMEWRLETFALQALVIHRASRRQMTQVFDGERFETVRYWPDIVATTVERMATAHHLDLVKHGFSAPVTPAYLSAIQDPWIQGPADADEIMATIALTGCKLRFRERQGLGPGYYLQKAAHTEKIPDILLTSPITTWKIYLGQLLDRELRS